MSARDAYQPGDLILVETAAGIQPARLVRALMAFGFADLEAAGCLGRTRFGVEIVDLEKTIAKGFFIEEVPCKRFYCASSSSR